MVEILQPAVSDTTSAYSAFIRQNGAWRVELSCGGAG
jgi:hypothetical protein